MRSILFLSLITIFLFNVTYAASSKVQSLDDIVAVVNDAPITQSELDESIETLKKQMAESNAPIPSEDALRKQMLQQMIDRKIQIQLAEQSGIKIDDAQIDKAINHIAESNHVTSKELYDQIEKQGLTLANYRKEIREEMLIQQIQQQQVASKITVSPQEVKDFMHSKPWKVSNNKEYHLEDIVIGLPDSPTTQQIQEAKKHADDLLDKIHHGMSFRDASIAESSGSKALQGGDLGWRKLPEVPAIFAEKVIHMQKDDIAGPIQAPNGFHILHLVESHSLSGNEPSSIDEVKQLIYQRKIEEAIQAWMTKLRSQAFINKHIETA